MKAYHIDRFGSVDGIVLRSSEDPRPGLKEILMRVRASSLNYRDLMVSTDVRNRTLSAIKNWTPRLSGVTPRFSRSNLSR